ncbi:DEKNAAC103251 [Brettanomyces naardenensis]|uniref:DEKNAAC103251 n=1 Tax=Brettanomyces naardenensis TaxID=13370 RepID=A0A448YMV4_BRENA|nr:DEKNAAC103251 [Brettanomyces naardenensis]
MTFIVTLAHFCEVHGPSMVMCTQAVDSSESPSKYYGSRIPDSQLCESCRLKIPKQMDAQRSDSSGTSPSSSTAASPKEMPDPSTIQTESKTTGSTYVSTQFPTSQHRYSSLRHIIMRIFTIETSSDTNQPLIFGDAKAGYSMALLFKIFDRTARGSERKYSIVVTSDKENDIFANYSLILLNLAKTVDYITTRSVEVTEKAAKNDSTNDVYLRRSAGVPKTKSLVTIMDDQSFFVRLHLLASSLLEELHC